MKSDEEEIQMNVMNEPSVVTSDSSGAIHNVNTKGLHDFPNELMIAILSKLDFKSRLVAQRVSPHWQQLVDQLFGAKTALAIDEEADNARILVEEKAKIGSNKLVAKYVYNLLSHSAREDAIEALIEIVAKYRRVVSLTVGLQRLNDNAFTVLCAEYRPDILYLNIVSHSDNSVRITRSEAQLVANNCPNLRDLDINAPNGIAIDESDIGLLFDGLRNLLSVKLYDHFTVKYTGNCFQYINAGVQDINTTGNILNATAISRLAVKSVDQLQKLEIKRFDPNCMAVIAEHFQSIKNLNIDLSGGAVDYDDNDIVFGPLFGSISGLANLEELTIGLPLKRVVVESRAIEVFSRCPKLKALHIRQGFLDEDCVEAIAKFIPNLVELCLEYIDFKSDNPIIDAMVCFAPIQDMRQLSKLSLMGNRDVTDDVFERLIKYCPQITKMDVSDTDQITTDAMVRCVDVCAQGGDKYLTAVFSAILETDFNELNQSVSKNLSLIYK